MRWLGYLVFGLLDGLVMMWWLDTPPLPAAVFGLVAAALVALWTELGLSRP